ncbi:MAG: hypothetical protein FJW39_04360 [Acidobacteria bacterium]|nr:hypothetical protein [Acidobacteriota bacterium]
MENVQSLLGLTSPPIGIAFLDSAPEGIKQWDGAAAPAGCAFWRQAMKGETFYTVPADHHNCAVGSHTHAISLPPERAKELEETIGFMVSNGYIRMEEVPAIPTQKTQPAAVAYGPVGATAFKPDVVIIAAPAATAMLVYEAAVRAGACDMSASILGRPGCAGIPFASQTGKAGLSFGCKGNRTFTGLGDGELYFFVPGASWDAVAAELPAVAGANRTMGAYYTQKQSQFPIL